MEARAHPPARPSRADRLAHVVATWFGSGHAPVAPGTVGTLATVPAYAILWAVGEPWLVPLAAVLVAACGVVASGRAAARSPVKDPSHVVVDEAAGFLVAACFVPLGWKGCLTAFALFRVIDIAKPAPIQALEALPGGWGIMADDLGAGLLAGGVGWLAWGLLAGAWAGVFTT